MKQYRFHRLASTLILELLTGQMSHYTSLSHFVPRYATSKKVRGNDVKFSIRQIASKKYVEMTWKFIEIWSSTYRRNIHVESTSIRRGVPVG